MVKQVSTIIDSGFGIDCKILKFLEPESQLGLGSFRIFIQGKHYGVADTDATLLGCSRDELSHRIERRGLHVASFSRIVAEEIASSFQSIVYSDEPLPSFFGGMPREEIERILTESRIVWAPDGDAAFDDGSHVLQFDSGENVRLVAFQTGRPGEIGCISDITLKSSVF